MIERIKFKSNYEYPYLAIIISFAVLYPLVIIPNPLSLIYLSKFLVLMLFSLVLLIYMTIDKSILRIANDPVLLIFLLLIIASVLFSDILITAWVGSITRFTGFLTYLFCIILFLAVNRGENHLVIIKGLVSGAIIVSIIALIQFYGLNFVPTTLVQERWIGSRGFGTLGNPNFLATYTVFILPASMMLYFHLNDKKWLVSSGIIFGALIVSLTRGAWLALAVLCIILFLYSFKKSEIQKKLLVTVIFFVIIFILLSVTSNNSIINRAATISGEIIEVAEYTGSSASIRILIWQETLIIIKDNWLFGVGPDNLRIPLPTGNLEDKAHNIFLEIAVTMGIPALIAYLIFLFLCLRNCYGEWFKVMLSFMIIAYIIQGQFNIDVVMNMPLFWIVLGLTQKEKFKQSALNEGKLNENNQHENLIKYDSRVISYTLAIGLIIFTVFIGTLLFYPRTGKVEIQGYSIYEGQIRGLNTYHGFGTLELENGDLYIGCFKHGLYDGEGVLKYRDGSYYEGEFREGYYHGQGKLVLSNGETQEGAYSRGLYVAD